MEQLALALEKDLLTYYGSPIISGEKLQMALGYPTMAAMKKSIIRKTFPVKTFKIANRRGQFALIKDISFWLAEQAR
ncbi:hypothetical protein [Aliiglaciecola sp. LCG003]|uniref:hypothetical protein n=1 Tax=Aliiglaciecola sp. LCG003 TaxID=3053655 RepID=UPI002573DD1A|nr:hypothetical protein [Aliiglaciecola sp. LCG003]WJG07956.1 hypothetical protein QR722_11340 [Aliiglaciecola sp. LCG003]